MKKHLPIVLGFILAAALAIVQIDRAGAQTSPGGAGVTFDEAAAPGANYDKAEFRMWYPPDIAQVRAALVLVPGSNGDWRNQVDDAGGGGWREFAVKNKVALVGVRFTDKPHDQSFIEEYANASRGTGQALLDALTSFAAKSKHPEVATAPRLLWGMSAGGQFNYEFVAWKPERVGAFVVNKGGIYYSALLPAAARAVPGIFFTGGKDLEFRTNTIVGLFAVNRRAGALWALAQEPGVAHVVGRSSDVTKVFFEDILSLRGKHAIADKDGFIGDLKAKTFQPAATAPASATSVPSAWLPTERVAKAWQAMGTEKPFEK